MLENIEINYKHTNHLNKLLRTFKIVHLKGVPYKDGDLLKFYDDLLPQLGTPVPMDEDVVDGNKTGAKWIEIKYDPAYPQSYRHSDTRQPLHTDGSYESNAPDINFFFCIEKARVGGATTFIDSRQVVAILKEYDKELLKSLFEIPVNFSKGIDGKIRPIITVVAEDYLMNWNYFRATTEQELCLKFHNFLEKKVVEGGQLLPVSLEVGEAVFFSDERLLHGRNSFIGNRCLLKGGVKL